MYRDEVVLTYSNIKIPDLVSVAKELIEEAGDVKVWLFQGEMGAGKTTLIKAIGKSLGIDDDMSSPTFGIVNEYAYQGNIIYHFDFYRIKSEDEAFDIGIEEYFYSGHYCFVEWPEKIPNLIPPNHAVITIDTDENKNRTIAISVHDGEKENRV